MISSTRTKAVLKRSVNVGLRLTTMLSKFGLIFVLAKFLPPAELGLFGLFAGMLSYLVMALGFDFYTYATRELITADRQSWLPIIRNQSVFYVIAYALLLPMCIGLFLFDFLPWELAVWFLPLLAAEHIAQEFNRILIAMGEPLWASIVLFVRGGAWSIAVAIWLSISPAQRSLSFVLAAWLIGSSVACVLAGTRLRKLDRSGLGSPIDWKWIRQGLSVAFPFVIATLCLRGIYTADRYWIEHLGGLDTVAAYVFYVGIGNAMVAIMDASVFSFQYPALVASAGANDSVRFEKQLKQMTLQTIGLTVFMSIAALFLTRPVLTWIDKPVYVANFPLLYWVISASALFVVGLIPHYALYARRMDRPILRAHVASVLVFVAAGALLVPRLGTSAVPAAMVVAFSFILIAKILSFAGAEPLPVKVVAA